MCEVYRAESIPPINFTQKLPDTYIKVSFGGISRKTKTIKNSSSPEYNQSVFVSTILPNHSKNLFIEL